MLLAIFVRFVRFAPRRQSRRLLDLLGVNAGSRMSCLQFCCGATTGSSAQRTSAQDECPGSTGSRSSVYQVALEVLERRVHQPDQSAILDEFASLSVTAGIDQVSIRSLLRNAVVTFGVLERTLHGAGGIAIHICH